MVAIIAEKTHNPLSMNNQRKYCLNKAVMEQRGFTGKLSLSHTLLKGEKIGKNEKLYTFLKILFSNTI